MSNLNSEIPDNINQLGPSFKLTLIHKNKENSCKDSLITPDGSINIRKVSQDITNEFLIIPTANRAKVKYIKKISFKKIQLCWRVRNKSII